MFDLSIIIPVFNNVNFTKNCLIDLMKLSNKHEIIIVDNNSTDSTKTVVKDFLNHKKPENSSLMYIECPKNYGFGKANNIAYQKSTGRNILFLNNDIRVRNNHENWTQELISFCEEGYLIGANGGLVNSNFDFIRETEELHEDKYFYLSGWCLASSRGIFDKLSTNYRRNENEEMEFEENYRAVWKEKYFAYFEDTDLSFTAKQLNIPFKVIKVPVHHFGHMTSNKLGLSSLYKTSQLIFKTEWKDYASLC